MEHDLKLTEVQTAILLTALTTDGKITPKEIRRAVPEIDRRVSRAEEMQRARCGLRGGANEHVWRILHQLQSKGLITSTAETRSGSRVWELTEAGVDVAVIEATKERSERIASEPTPGESDEDEVSGEALGGFAVPQDC